MSKFRDMIIAVQDDIDLGELSFAQIALKYGITLREVDALALDLMERDTVFADGPEVGYHDEMERDHDEAYEPEYDEGYEDRYLDASYEDRYELNDF